MSFEGLLGERETAMPEYMTPESTAGEVLGTRFRQALESNPLTAAIRRENLSTARDVGRLLPADSARARVREAGLDGALTIPDQGITEPALDMLIRRKREERKRQDVLARSPGGAALEVAGFGVEFGASLLDPINVASGFIPVVGPARYARWLAAAGEGALGAAGRTGIRAGVGAVEGTLGAALIEPSIYAGMTEQQADYTMSDSLYNIAFGGILGGGLHVIGGAGLDLYRYARGRPLLDAVANAPDLSPPDVPAGTVLGGEAAVRIGDAYVPAQWAVVEADDVAATMGRAENQPRDRNRAASQAQIRDIANNLDFNLLADSPVMDYGAPTLARDGRVVGGNGRMAAIRQAYEGGTGYRYQEPLREALARFGIDPEELAKFKRPVLVRVLGEDVDVRRAAIASNEGGALRMSALEQAKVDADRLGDLSGIDVGDAGELNRAGNMPLIRRWVGEQPLTQRAALQDADGFLSAEGLTRLRNAILYRAFGDSPTLQRLIEATDPGLRNVASALTRAAGRVAEVRDAIARGDLYDLDISPDVQAAVEKLVRLREEGMTVPDYLAQQQMFGAELSPEAVDVLRFMDRNIRSPAGMAEFLQRYYEGVIDSGSPNQADMFGAGAPTKAELLARAADRVVPAAEVVENLRPETREAALRTAVAQAVTGREIDVEPVVDLDPSRRTSADPVSEARAAAERSASPEQATLVDFDAATETPEPKPAGPELDEAQAALDEALTLAKDAAKAGSDAYKFSRGDGAAVAVDVPSLQWWSRPRVGLRRFEFTLPDNGIRYVIDVEDVSSKDATPLWRAMRKQDRYLVIKEFRFSNQSSDEHFGITGTGSARSVLAIIRAAFAKHAATPSVIYFSAKGSARARIYARATSNAEGRTLFARKDGDTVHFVSTPNDLADAVRSTARAENIDWSEGAAITELAGGKFSIGDTIDAPSAVETITEAVRASFGEATDALLQAGRIKVIENADEAPGGPHPEDVRAIYAPDGTTYVVASNMPLDQVRGIVLHEIGVHAGMREMLGDDLWARTLGEVERLSAAGDAAILRARAMVPEDTPQHLVHEETLAYLVQTAPELPLVRRIIAAVKAWLYRVTGGRMNIGEDELVSLAQSALRRQARGAVAEMGGARYAGEQVNTPAFKAWFGDSRVVDESGKPLVVYHGTPSGGFAVFDRSRIGKRGTFESARAGFYFSSGTQYAGMLARDAKETGPSIYPVYLSIKNPLRVFTTELTDRAEVDAMISAATRGGHDGIVDEMGNFVAFRPEQIKSAVGNVGTFDPNNPDIRYSRGPERADDPNAEFKPFDEAIKRAELYSKAVRAAAERIGDDEAARQAMRAATADKLGADEIDALLDQLKAENRKVRARLRKARQQFTSDDTVDALQSDAMQAADTLANNITMDATIAKRNAALALTARTRAAGRILNEFAKNPTEGLLGLLGSSSFARQGSKDSVFQWQRTYFMRWTKGALAELEQAGLAEAFVRNAYDRSVARALFQLSLPMPRLDGMEPEAVKIAQIIHKYAEDSRVTRNRYGAWIGKLQGYIGSQSHDFMKIRAAGRDAWKDFVRGRLDYERMELEPGDSTERMLDRLWEDFAAGRHMQSSTDPNSNAALLQPGSLARRASQSRVLHFKDADAQFDYLQTFGAGKLHEAVLGDLSRASQQAGLLRVLGPNPEDTLKRVMDEVEESLRGDPDVTRKFAEARGTAEALLTMLDGRANIPGSHLGARVGAGLRAWQTLSKLGSALASAVTDLPVYASAIRYQGRGGLLSGIGEGMGNLLSGRPKGERRQILDMIGSVADGMIGGIAARFDADEVLSGKTSELMRVYFRLNGLQWWTDTLREGMELGTSNWLGGLRGKAFDKLDAEAQRVLRLYNIDEAKWDVLRLAVHAGKDGRTYLVPEAMRHVPEGVVRGFVERQGRTVSDVAVANARTDLADTLRGLIIDQAMTAVIEPDVRSRYFWTRGSRPGTWLGELSRFVGQFKGFSTALTRQIGGREVYGRGYDTLGEYLQRGHGDMLGLAQLMLAMTAFGYIAMTAKDALKGRKPRDPESPAVWMAALAQGGALGIYGDFMLGTSNRFGKGILDTAAGPVLGTIADADEIRRRAMNGDDVASSAFRIGVNNTPFLNLFYVRTAMDYLLLYRIQEALNPGSIRRMERRVRQENAQEFYLPPSAAVN